MKNSYCECHEYPTRDLIVDTMSRTDGRTDWRGLYVKLSFFSTLFKTLLRHGRGASCRLCRLTVYTVTEIITIYYKNRTKRINTQRGEKCRISLCYSWWYIYLPLVFKLLNCEEMCGVTDRNYRVVSYLTSEIISWTLKWKWK
jgi:hypothetical protein